MPEQRLIIGTRGSALALWQTEHVAAQLLAIVPDLDVKVKKIKTQGDVVRDRPLWQVPRESRGFFVKEIENALLAGEIDLAVHSLKDVPTELPAGLALGAILKRADPRDALVVRGGPAHLPWQLAPTEFAVGNGGALSALPAGACVGTGSLRRRAQLLAARPDLEVAHLRGNVDTRLRKLRDGQYDAVVLAVAGLDRLGLNGRRAHVVHRLSFAVMLPAPAQAALALQCRADDAATLALLRPLHHRSTGVAVTAERAFLNGLSSGCSAPVAAYALECSHNGGSNGGGLILKLRGLVASLDGRQVVRVSAEGALQEPEELGYRLAQDALDRGARAILESILCATV